jgi:hypothetical protein
MVALPFVIGAEPPQPAGAWGRAGRETARLKQLACGVAAAKRVAERLRCAMGRTSIHIGHAFLRCTLSVRCAAPCDREVIAQALAGGR